MKFAKKKSALATIILYRPRTFLMRHSILSTMSNIIFKQKMNDKNSFTKRKNFGQGILRKLTSMNKIMVIWANRSCALLFSINFYSKQFARKNKFLKVRWVWSIWKDFHNSIDVKSLSGNRNKVKSLSSDITDSLKMKREILRFQPNFC